MERSRTVARREAFLEAVLSPEGRWIAYESDMSRDSEIYFRPIRTEPQIGVTGRRPTALLESKGGELFYQKATGVFAVRIVNGARVGNPTRVFDRSDAVERNWTVAPDGERYLVAENSRAPHINVVLNWFEELKAKVANGR